MFDRYPSSNEGAGRLTRRDFVLSTGALLTASAVSGCKFGGGANAAGDVRLGAGDAAGIGLPCLQAPGETTMGVAWTVPSLSKGAVEVADNPEMRNPCLFRPGGLGLVPIDDCVLSVRITGLRPSTRYWYRTVTTPFLAYENAYSARLGADVRSDVYSFMTLGENVPAHFCMMSDTHANWDSFGLVARKIKELSPTAVVWNGDATNTTQDKKTAAEIFLNPPVEDRDYASQIPVFFENGNHDFRGSWISRKEEVVMPRLPAERSARHWELKWNFAVRCGEMALIGMDTGEDKPDTHPKWMGLANYSPYRRAQAEWLEEQFARPEIAQAPFKVVFCHIPLWPRTEKDRKPPWDGSTVDPRGYAYWSRECHDLWAPIFERNGVHLVAVGHRHSFDFSPACKGHPWAMVNGGGPELGYRNDWTNNRRIPAPEKFPTVVEGKVVNGRLRLRVHDVFHSRLVLDQDIEG